MHGLSTLRLGRVHRAAVAAVATTWAMSLGWQASAQTDGVPAARANDFARELAAAGIGGEQLRFFGQWDGQWKPHHDALAAQLLFRLQRHDVERTAATLPRLSEANSSGAAPQLGQLYRLAGAVTSVESLRWAQEDAGPNARYRCDMRATDGSADYTVLSAAVPQQWTRRNNLQKPIENVRAIGVLLGANPSNDSNDETDRPRFVLLTERFEWRPVDHPNAGVAWLAKRGMDAGLLDEVQHSRPLLKPNQSRESDAFFACLTIMRATQLSELAAQIRSSIRQSTPTLRTKAEQAELDWQRASAAGDTSAEMQADARREALLREAVATQADKGLTSVAPLFLTPRGATGQFVLIEGVARRAVRISVSGPKVAPSTASRPGRSGEAAAVGDYYEVEVFTPDSQNLPVVCCLARLPEGFPIGEILREPVRVAGIFFKKWAYQTRRPGAEGGPRSQLGAAPIVIGPSLVSLAAGQGAANSPQAAIWGGVLCLLGLALLWGVFWRTDRSDRLARRRRLDDAGCLEELNASAPTRN